MGILNRDAILKAEDLPKQIVNVPEWGGDVYIRSMTGTERDDFEATMFENGRAKLTNIRARLVAMVCVDEKGDRLFTEADVEALGKKAASALDRVFAAANKLNALSSGEVEAAKKP